MPATPRNRTDACSGVADVHTVPPRSAQRARSVAGPSSPRTSTSTGESASGDPA
jgi:hypothetical protein